MKPTSCSCPTLDPVPSCRQVYDRASRIKPRRRRTERYGRLGPFTYWDLHDFAALLMSALAFLYGGFWFGVRSVLGLPDPDTHLNPSPIRAQLILHCRIW